MTFTFVDCHGLGGGLSLGLTQAGGQMLHRQGLSFGKKNVEANRDHFNGGEWTYEYDDKHITDTWYVPNDDVDVVAGNPPCSGFSVLSSKAYRGNESPANECMHSFVAYTARVRPKIAVFESVGQAYSQGIELMRDLRGKLEANSGLEYDLYHVKHNALGAGGGAIRARYFWVVSRIPFGIEIEEPERVPTIIDVIGDLTDLPLHWEPQSYRSPETWWSGAKRDPSGIVDGHITKDATHTRRLHDLIKATNWPVGWDESQVLKYAYDRDGKLPDSWSEDHTQKIINKNFHLGFNCAFRWRSTRPGYVITGDAPNKIIHPTEPRLLTYRELYRIQSFPDTWKLEGLREDSKVGAYPGKGVSVDCGAWLGKWIDAALRGEPGSYRGTELGYREQLIDSSKDHAAALKRLLAVTEAV